MDRLTVTELAPTLSSVGLPTVAINPKPGGETPPTCIVCFTQPTTHSTLCCHQGVCNPCVTRMQESRLPCPYCRERVMTGMKNQKFHRFLERRLFKQARPSTSGGPGSRKAIATSRERGDKGRFVPKQTVTSVAGTTLPSLERER